MTSYNIEAEQILLGALLCNTDAMPDCLPLEGKDFFEPIHGRIFDKILDNYHNSRTNSALTLKSHFENDEDLEQVGGSSYLLKLQAMAVSPYMADKVAPGMAAVIRASAMRRSIDALLDEIKQRNADATIDPFTLQSELIWRADKLNYSPPKIKTSKEVMEAICDGLKAEPDIYPTGVRCLDMGMAGGLYAGKAYGIAAKKKTGKTAMLATIAHNVNEKILFIACEMGSQQIQERIAARQMQINPVSFVNRQRNNQDFQLACARLAVRDQGKILYADKPGLTFTGLKSLVMSAVRTLKVKGVILDYWQLIGGKPKEISTAQHLDEVAQWLAEIAIKENIFVLTACQVNQEDNTRGSEGLRLAFDQVYMLKKSEQNPTYCWLEMMDTRYTAWEDLGNENNPSLHLNDKGAFFEDFN